VRPFAQVRTFLSPRFNSMSFSGLTRTTTEMFSFWLGERASEEDAIILPLLRTGVRASCPLDGAFPSASLSTPLSRFLPFSEFLRKHTKSRMSTQWQNPENQRIMSKVVSKALELTFGMYSHILDLVAFGVDQIGGPTGDGEGKARCRQLTG